MDWRCFDINQYTSTLPQARVYQCDVTVTPSDHDVFNVGGSPQLCSQSGRTMQEHNTPFEMDTHDRRKILYHIQKGHSQRKKERQNELWEYLHTVTLIITKDVLVYMPKL